PGVGFARTPPVYLARGDVIRVEIDHVGSLANRVT
ncbi:MAG: fumarylacetoacetate hydrolase family protein, partial [Acidimicrobiia bacterium]